MTDWDGGTVHLICRMLHLFTVRRSAPMLRKRRWSLWRTLWWGVVREWHLTYPLSPSMPLVDPIRHVA